MLIANSSVDSVTEIQKGIHLLKVHSPEIAALGRPGQFCNIKVGESCYPLLRRPFSICDIEGEYIYFMFNIFGEGTKLLANKARNDFIDILGPLGNGFDLSGDFETAVIVAGGLGTAPFPLLTKELKHKEIYTFVGGRTSNDVITYRLENILTATDDGTNGFHGNVVELLETNIDKFKNKAARLFSCGPNAMLRALKEYCIENDLDCQASTECAMACGFGICQGCPIEASDKSKYYLVCKDGPVFNVRDVII